MEQDKRKRKYLVGFSGERQVAYGGPDFRYTEPYTLTEARRVLHALSKGKRGTKRVIYELVPVEKED